MTKLNTPTKIRTRIAPSPTGEDLHIGSVYTGLFNYVFAKKHHGQFIVRIEDTDRERFVKGAEAKMMDSLEWMGIRSDENIRVGGLFAPYRQSERLPVYQKYAHQLVEKGIAYYCFCTGERLKSLRDKLQQQGLPTMYDGLCKSLRGQKAEQLIKTQPFVIRIEMPNKGVTTFEDLVRGEITFENKLIDDQVILKSDGFPTYHLAVVVDDHLMNISHVIRGEEWISSTPKHLVLYRALGWEPPKYAHLPLLRNPDKSKLSKRKNPVWASWYRQHGFLPEAVINYLGTLTWSMPGGQDIFSLEEMIAHFDLTAIKTTAPVFDIVKLKWFNKQYMMQKSPLDMHSLLKKVSRFASLANFDTLLPQIIPLVQSRISTLDEFDPMVAFLFEPVSRFEKPIHKEWIKLVLSELRQSSWKKSEIELHVRRVAETEKIKPKDLFMELRIAITGKTVGPPLLESLELLGKDEVLRRLTLLI